DTAHKAEGTGLGLTITRKIIELMGSEIHLESTYGQGSTFWFELDLPEATDWHQPTSARSQQSILGYHGDRRTILVVDDRWENRSVLVNLLTSIGFEVLEASNGQEGFETAKDHQPDAIITDLAMPVMNGFEMTKQLRAVEAFRDAVIIASSASVFNFNRQQSHEAGCSDFLPKPVQAMELYDQLQHHLQLQWIYETEAPVATVLPAETLKAPTATDLKALYAAAKAGYINRIQAEANQLKTLHPQYTPFANQVLALADEFDEEAIVQLIAPYMA
ncbi:MAG TPA: response regulator, partial [Candidatus Obscuribacterales bacterium]